jgi:bifunctional non-homologous end joining protein LigD
MLAVSRAEPPPDQGNWALEMKWDGVRALAYVEGGLVRLMSRSERDITVTYPELAALAAAAGDRQLLLDGEIVVFGERGWPRFEAIQHRMHVSSPSQAAMLAGQAPVTYLVFDLLQLDGTPLLEAAYSARRALLEELGLSGRYWQVPPAFPGEDFDAVREVSLANGMEGVVAKRLDSKYAPGVRTDNWRKIKNTRRQEAVVAGYKPGKGNRAGLVGSLIIGVNGASGLVYAGHVGTGFTVETLRMLGGRLGPLRRVSSPFAGPVPPEYARTAVWVEPRLVIDVTFDSWTKEGRMRLPVYKGLRDDIDPAEVIREPDGLAPPRLRLLGTGTASGLAGPLGDQEQRVAGQGGVVGDQALADHLLEPRPRHPCLAHVLLLVFPVRRPGLKAGGQEVMPHLAGEAVGDVQQAEPGEPAGPQAGFLGELEPGQLLRAAGLPGREPALGERPGAPPDRVPVLLDQVETVVLRRDDQREIGLLDERVRAAGAVAPFDLVPAQPHPAVLVDHAGVERADVRPFACDRVRCSPVFSGGHPVKVPARMLSPPARRAACRGRARRPRAACAREGARRSRSRRARPPQAA